MDSDQEMETGASSSSPDVSQLVLWSSINALMSSHLVEKEKELRIKCEMEVLSMKEELHRMGDDCLKTTKMLEATLKKKSVAEVRLKTNLKTLEDERRRREAIASQFKQELDKKTKATAEGEAAAKALQLELGNLKPKKEEELKLNDQVIKLREECMLKEAILEDAKEEIGKAQMQLSVGASRLRDKEKAVEELEARASTVEGDVNAGIFKKQLDLDDLVKEQEKVADLEDQLKSAINEDANWEQKWQTIKEFMDGNSQSVPVPSTSRCSGYGSSMADTSVGNGTGSTNHHDQSNATGLMDVVDPFPTSNSSVDASQEGSGEQSSGQFSNLFVPPSEFSLQKISKRRASSKSNSSNESLPATSQAVPTVSAGSTPFKRSKLRSNTRTSQKDVTRAGVFECSRCFEKFNEHKRLKQHLIIFHKLDYKLNHGCQKCGFACQTRSQLSRHNRVVHKSYTYKVQD